MRSARPPEDETASDVDGHVHTTQHGNRSMASLEEKEGQQAHGGLAEASALNSDAEGCTVPMSSQDSIPPHDFCAPYVSDNPEVRNRHI